MESEPISSEPPAAGPTPPRFFLAVEFLALFVGLPLLPALEILRVPPIPAALALGAFCTLILIWDPSFERRAFWHGHGLRSELRGILLLFAAGGAAISLGVWLFAPELLFGFPRSRPILWAAVMVLYPLLSVYPQELIYRAFFFHRYRRIFGTGWAMVAASAAAFGFMHVIFGNLLAVVMTLVGGLIFGWRYMKSRSLAAVSFEHALYGQLVFTIGLGRYFYHGAG